MNKKSQMTKFTLKDFQKMFANDDVCLDYIRHIKFSERIDCPKCGKKSLFHRASNRKTYACDHCGFPLSPAANTIFHKSPTPLTIWFYVIYLMAQTRGGISAKQIQRETGVTYKTAWRMCKEVRDILSEDFEKFSGIVEADESYFGGEERNKHANKRTMGAKGRSLKTKTPVLGLANRGGKLETHVVKNTKSDTIIPIVWANVNKDAEIHTDEYQSYNLLPLMGYTHGVVRHGNKIYVDGDVHTNTVEGFWSQAKNGIRGVYHAVSSKYLQHYLDEYSFRYNHRNDVMPMFFSFLSRAILASSRSR